MSFPALNICFEYLQIEFRTSWTSSHTHGKQNLPSKVHSPFDFRRLGGSRLHLVFPLEVPLQTCGATVQWSQKLLIQVDERKFSYPWCFAHDDSLQ